MYLPHKQGTETTVQQESYLRQFKQVVPSQYPSEVYVHEEHLEQRVQTAGLPNVVKSNSSCRHRKEEVNSKIGTRKENENHLRDGKLLFVHIHPSSAQVQHLAQTLERVQPTFKQITFTFVWQLTGKIQVSKDPDTQMSFFFFVSVLKKGTSLREVEKVSQSCSHCIQKKWILLILLWGTEITIRNSEVITKEREGMEQKLRTTELHTASGNEGYI